MYIYICTNMCVNQRLEVLLSLVLYIYFALSLSVCVCVCVCDLNVVKGFRASKNKNIPNFRSWLSSTEFLEIMNLLIIT